VSTSPDTLQSDSKPTFPPDRAVKPRKIRNAPGIKTSIIQQRLSGKSKRSIANELKIGRNTVTKVLQDSNVEQALNAGLLSCAPLIPKAVQALEKTLDRGDGALGLKFLNDIGVLGDRKGNAAPESLHLTQAVSIMFKTKDLPQQPTIEVKAPEPVPPADK
jgi:hypothetical protein